MVSVPEAFGAAPACEQASPPEHISLPVCLDAQCLCFIAWMQLGCLAWSCSHCTVLVLAGARGTETGAPTPPLGDPKQWARFCWCPRCDGRPRAHPGLRFPCTRRPRLFRPSSTGPAFSGGRPVSHHSWAPQARAALAGLSLPSQGPAEVRRLKGNTPS